MEFIEYLCNFLWRLWWFIKVELCALTYTFRQAFIGRTKPSGLIRRPGDVAIVTGGLHGIGREITRQLLELGVTVYTAGPELRGNSEVLKEFQTTYGVNKVCYLPLDLSSMSSVKQCADSFISSNLNLNVLVCNAGVMFSPFSLTVDRFESQLSINFLGHAYLTLLLLPALLNAGSDERYARVVMVTSCIHLAGDLEFDDLNARWRYSPERAYAQSKLAQVTFAFYLNRVLSAEGHKVTASAVSPGVVRTGLCRDHRWYHGTALGQYLFKSATEGAYCSVYAAMSEEVERKGGLYLDDCKVTAANPKARGEATQRQLWNETCRLLGLGGNHEARLLDVLL